MRQDHGPWAYPPRRRKEIPTVRITLALTLVAAIASSLVVGHVTTKAIANLAHQNARN